MGNQIEEMAVENLVAFLWHNTAMYDEDLIFDVAEAIVNEGYRKQIKGEWVKVMNHKECSKCGYNAPYKKIKAGYHLQDLSNYCPNCGAKMKGADNGKADRGNQRDYRFKNMRIVQSDM